MIADAGRHLGVAAANLCNLVDPDIVVVGGQLVTAGEILLAPLRDVLQQRALPSTRGPVDVVAGTLGATAELRGAITLAADHARVLTLGGLG